MSGRSGNKILNFHKGVALLCVAILSSCASADSLQDTPPELPTSEAALLDDSDKAMPVVEPGAGVDVFADLQPEAEGTSQAAVDPSSPFYNPIGGESLGRVAYTLYGDRSKAQTLIQLNPDLKKVKNLTSDQNVYFDFSGVNPEPTFLTKGLLDRYAPQLAEKVSAKSLSKSDIVIGSGETLQMVSQRLYGTTRYWTEIYLLNHSKLGNYDRIPAGTSLTVYQRAGDGLAKIEPSIPSEPAPVINDKAPQVEQAISETAQPPVESLATAQSASATSPAETPLPFDPIPDTATSASVAQVDQKAPEMPKTSSLVAKNAAETITSSIAGNTNYRRILYIGLIILIAGAAFFLTRPVNKKKFDMLDATTTETSAGRTKLAKDSHDLFVG